MKHNIDPSRRRLLPSALLALAATTLISACEGAPAPTKTVTVTRTVTPKAAGPKAHTKPEAKNNSTPHHAKPVRLTKANMEKPLSPRGGDYNIAENAAYDADNGEFGAASNRLARITSTKVKSEATHAVQVAIAENAAYDADNGELAKASAELGQVTLKDVKTKANEAVSYAIAENAAFDATNDEFASAKRKESMIHDPTLVATVERAINQERSGKTDSAGSTWNNLYDAAQIKWNDLYDQENSEWNTLHLHSDDYWHQYDQAPDK